jgi:hypothetical protein
VLFQSDWEADHCQKQNPDWDFLSMQFRKQRDG